MAMNYVHAEEVLPPDLIKRVRKYHTGLILIPADREFFEDRYREVLSLHEKGYPTSIIAERVHLCRRRVQQIIREARGAEGRGRAK
jgi:DNA-binding NarL/FixJ family response regulator